MKLVTVKIECSSELEDGLTYFLQEDLKAEGIESRKKSDFYQEEDKHDSSIVFIDEIKNLPEDLELTGYFKEGIDLENTISRIKAKILEMKSYGLKTGDVQISSYETKDEDWNKSWQKYYHSIDFSRHLAIVPQWEKYEPIFKDQKLIILDPGLAFGTGGHTTTQLVLLALERTLIKPSDVMDVGTGSGILAIAASRLGAKEILATDISDEAVTAAKENIQLNAIDNITVRKANLLKDTEQKFDIIIANILAEILLDLIPDLNEHLKENGKVIFSGIDYMQLPKIEKALNKYNFKIEMQMQENRWICLIISKSK